MRSDPAPDKRLAMSIKQACETLGISRATLWRQIKSGSVHTITIGRRRLVPLKSVEKLLSDGASL